MNLIMNMMIVITIILSYEFYKIIYNNQIVVILGCSDNIIQNERIKTTINYLRETNKKITLFITGGIKGNQMNSEASKILKEIEYDRSINLSNIQIIYDDKATNTAENFRNLKEWVFESSTVGSFTNDESIDKVKILTKNFVPFVKDELLIKNNVLNDPEALLLSNSHMLVNVLRKLIRSTASLRTDMFHIINLTLSNASVSEFIKKDIVIITSDFHKHRASLIFDGIFNGKIDPTWLLSKSKCNACWTNERYHIQNVSNDIKNAIA